MRPPGKRNGRITPPRIKRAKAMRERGMSYRAIQAAMEVYEGDAPCVETLRRYLRAAGCPPTPHGESYKQNFKHCQ